jgi:hypothetical protein
MTNPERENPRISINKLSEYITALPARRRKIIKDQKRPSNFIVPYYRDAEKIVVDYFVVSNQSEEWLESRIQNLSDRTVTSDWDENRRSICIEAIECFSEFIEEFSFNSLCCIAGEASPEKLKIAGVQVSVRPEIYLTDEQKNIKGCVKLIFGKGRQVSESEAGYTGTCLQRWMEDFHGIHDYKTCFALDIFAGKLYTAPKAYKRKLSDMEAACEEISSAWTRV